MNTKKPAILGGEPTAKNPIPFTKVEIGDEEKRAVQEILESKWFVNGPYTEKLEKEFARYVGTKYALAVSNGTDGLFLAYLALGLTFRKKIFTTPLTFIATASTIIHTGAIPIFGDVDNYGNLKVPSEENADIDGISIVHLYGYPIDFDSFKEVVENLGVPLIEDASHAHGAEYKNKKIGSLGDIAVFSLYPSKIIAAGGWGGVITTNNEELYTKIKLLRAHGELRVLEGAKGAYQYIRLGYNLRLSEIEAAIAYHQLKKLNSFIARRRKNAKKLIELLGDINGIILPREEPGRKHAYYIFNIVIQPNTVGWDRDSFVKALVAEGISARRGYHLPLHKTELFKKINDPETNHFALINEYPEYSKMSFPNAEFLSANSVWLPLYPSMTEEEIELIAEAIRKLIEWKKR